MTTRLITLFVAAWALSTSAPSFSQEFETFPDAEITNDQWQQRVEEARRRSEQYVANARTRSVDPLTSDKEEAEASDQRAMNDPSLQRGDIIATSRGFVVFVGRDSDERQASDFLPVPSPRSPPSRGQTAESR